MLLLKIQAVSTHVTSLTNKQNESDLIQVALYKVISPNNLSKVNRIKTVEGTGTNYNYMSRIQVVKTEKVERKQKQDASSLNEQTIASLLKRIEEIKMNANKHDENMVKIQKLVQNKEGMMIDSDNLEPSNCPW